MQRRAATAGAALAALLLILSGIFTPAAAQSAAGRWAVMLRGGAPGVLRGELRLEATGPAIGGTLWLESLDAPVPVRGRAAGREVTFEARIPSRTEFRGALEGNVLRGIVSDTGGARPWTATRLQEETEFYPVLPRFTLRQVVAGRRAGMLVVPGPWLAAARERDWGTDSTYAAIARLSGLARLAGDSLEQLSAARVMGMARRAEMRAAVERTLAAMRSQIADAAVRARFDRVFRPRGTWLVDVHDAALLLARAAFPALDESAVRDALGAIGALPDGRDPDDALARALYRLSVLRSADSVAFGEVSAAMRKAAPGSHAAVAALLSAYDAAEDWHADALRFLVAERWLPGDRPVSVAELVEASWRGRVDSVKLPEIRPYHFQHPQAVPRYGVPGPLFSRLVRPENLSARQWMERHGGAGLLETLRGLELDLGPSAELAAPAETLRITSVREQARQSANGFLEPRDAILVDPGYVPLLALGAVIHEWQHLLEERRRRTTLAGGKGEVLVIPAIDPFIAEGAAERRTEHLLAPFLERFPLLGLSEVEKRARLAARSADEHHVLGYALVRALEEAVPDIARREAILIRAGDDLAAAADDGELARAWRKHRGTAPLRLDAPSRRVLVPETTFTVEDRFPDVLEVRVLTPDAPGRD
ncbi:MAG TPA: hypothetical protein VF037_11545 [Gemmatimonadales bacterium]